MKKLILCCFLFAGVIVADERYVVTPGGDYYLIPKGQNALQVARAHGLTGADASVCTDKATFGFSPDKFPPTGGHIGFHRDVIGSWFIVPATGTIDTVFWNALSVCSADSTLYLRIHTSNVYPGHGPGYNGFPLPSSSTCWGYYDNTNDVDNGVAAFPEEATGPWHGTVDTNAANTASFPPTAAEIWGFGGFPAVTHANTLNIADLDILGKPTVTAGDRIMINFRINGVHGEPCTGGSTTDLTTGFRTSPEPNPLSTQNWKFYEHVVTFQAGYACKGWVARGDFQISIWYSMTVSSNVPPRFVDYDRLSTTFSPAVRTVSSDIDDCNPASPGSAGVATAKIRYSVDNVLRPDVVMTNLGGTTWEGDIPGSPVGSTVRYKLVASDFDGAVDSTATVTYKVAELGNGWYSVDTAAACTPQDISGTGAAIAPSSFFNPHNTGSGTAPKDDGTAGPFNMGGNFVVFGDTFRYAWVGVNGAIALTKTAADTNDANANGFATSGWDFPYSPVRHGRADTTNLTGMPRMFIAPFFADHIVEQDSPAATFGHIRTGNNGDANKFIVEWDSVGTFDTNGSTADITTFRVVLDRADGTVEFQYKSCGLNGLDSAALVGMQYDTSSVGHPNPYLFLNNATYPYETKPRDNYCVRFIPAVGTSVADGWNMVSVSGTPADANYAKTHLFPEATSPAFSYGTGYIAQPTLANGPGYWLKFAGGSRAGSVPANWLSCVVVSVQDKWNMIGSVSGLVPTASITPGGGTIGITSPFYGYLGGYSAASTLEPGKAYWVKVNGAGTLSLCASAMAPKAQPSAAELGLGDMNTVTVRDARGQSQTLYFGEAGLLQTDASYYDMPPAPPAGGFDARFSLSGRMVETYPAQADKAVDFPISIQSAVYPVTISWRVNAAAEGRTFEVAAGQKRTTMTGAGSKVIADASVKSVVIRLAAGTTPKEFALSQNYPNPFNPATRFRVDVAKNSPVDVSVYDILGRKIVTLLSGEKAEGSYTMEWNGKDAQGLTMPSGIYFIRMTAGEFTDSRKVSLLK